MALAVAPCLPARDYRVNSESERWKELRKEFGSLTIDLDTDYGLDGGWGLLLELRLLLETVGDCGVAGGGWGAGVAEQASGMSFASAWWCSHLECSELFQD